MTSFFSQAGGGATGGSVESRALKSINSQDKSFVNKDFVKNIAWLNQSVDTLSAYTQKLQKGVDNANQNFIEQITGFASDLFVLFAGGEPTGIEMGDLKYIIQGMGAIFGIDPDTPFPLNLFDAAWNMFSKYIVPLEQFSDLIFDAIMAWAEEFGLSPEFIDALQELKDALEALGTTFSDFFNSIRDLMDVFGDIPILGDFWDTLVDMLTGVDMSALKPVISMLADLGLPFIQALTAIVNAGNAFLKPFSKISGGQITTLGDNVVPAVADNTSIWLVGVDSTNAWAYDSGQKAFTTLGSGLTKEVNTQTITPCDPGTDIVASAKIRWSGIPSGSNGFGMQIIWYLGQTEVSPRTTINIASGHGSSSAGTDFVEIRNDALTVPQNVDGFKVGAYVNGGLVSGQVWIKDLSLQISGKIEQDMISGLLETLASFLPFDIFTSILGSGAGQNDIISYLLGMLPFGSANSGLPNIGSGQIGNIAQNLLIDPLFRGIGSFLPGSGISWDGTTSHSSVGGSALFDIVSGIAQSFLGNDIAVTPGDTIDSSIWTKWTGVTGSGPISMNLNLYNSGGSLVGTQVLDSVIPGLNGAWQQLTGSFTIPSGVSSVALQLNVSDLLNGGKVWFDDGSVTKPNLVNPGAIGSGLGLTDNMMDDWQLFIDTITQQANSTLGQMSSKVSSFLDSFSPLNGNNILGGNISTDFISDLQDNFNSIVQQLLGWDPPESGTWYSPSDSSGALGSQADTVLGIGQQVTDQIAKIFNLNTWVNSLNTRVQTLETAGGGSGGSLPSGGSQVDDFSRTGALGSDWSNTDSLWQCDGQQCYFNTTTYTNRVATCRFATDSSTVYQDISVQIGNQAPSKFGSYYGWNYAYGRTMAICFAIRADGYWQILYSGSVIASGSGATLGTGSTMRLLCGDKASSNANKYTIYVNGSGLWTGTISAGSGKGWGFGAEMNGMGSWITGPSVGWPGKVTRWLGVDQ